MVIAREVEESRSPQNIPVRPVTSTRFPLPVGMMMKAIEAAAMIRIRPAKYE